MCMVGVSLPPDDSPDQATVTETRWIVCDRDWWTCGFVLIRCDVWWRNITTNDVMLDVLFDDDDDEMWTGFG